MSRLLSDDEIEALLRGVADGAIPTGGRGRGSGNAVRALDLTREERSLRGQLPGLELVTEHFARRLATVLGAAFAARPRVTPSALERIRFAGVLARLTRPLCVQLFRLEPLRGQGMLVLTPALVAALLQAACGGVPARRATIAGREFSAIEQRVLERLAGRILQELGAAWRPLGVRGCTLTGSETNPLFTPLAGPRDLVVLVELRVEAEGVEDGLVSLVLRDAALDPIRQRLHALPIPAADAPAAWGERWRALVAEVEVELTGELGARRMQLGEVLALRVGDVIPLRTGRNGPAVVRIAGRACFVGEPGVSGGSHAVRVTGRA